MTKLKDRKWLEKYLNVDIISGETQIQDLFIILAKKVEKLEKGTIILDSNYSCGHGSCLPGKCNYKEKEKKHEIDFSHTDL